VIGLDSLSNDGRDCAFGEELAMSIHPNAH
jgi:hypothetical protein